MKVVFNNRKPEVPASVFYIQALADLLDIHFNNRSSYSDFDIALFMSHPQDLQDVVMAGQENPNLKIGLIDPRRSINPNRVNDIDFLIVDSLEMKDFFSKYRQKKWTGW